MSTLATGALTTNASQSQSRENAPQAPQVGAAAQPTGNAPNVAQRQPQGRGGGLRNIRDGLKMLLGIRP